MLMPSPQRLSTSMFSGRTPIGPSVVASRCQPFGGSSGPSQHWIFISQGPDLLIAVPLRLERGIPQTTGVSHLKSDRIILGTSKLHAIQQGHEAVASQHGCRRPMSSEPLGPHALHGGLCRTCG